MAVILSSFTSQAELQAVVENHAAALSTLQSSVSNNGAALTAMKSDVAALKSQVAGMSGQTGTATPTPTPTPTPSVSATVANPSAAMAQVAFSVTGTISGTATAYAVLRLNGVDQGARAPVTISGTGWTASLTAPNPGSYTAAVYSAMTAGNKLAESASFTVGAYVAPPSVDTGFDGLSRKAAYVRDNWGVCDGLDEPPATIAARLNVIGTRKVRTNFFANGTSKTAKIQALTAAMQSAGFSTPTVKAQALVMAYMNDSTTATQMAPQLVAAASAGVLYMVEGPNELNNSETGNGTHGPDDTINKIGSAQYPGNFKDWVLWLYRLKAANPAAFAGVPLIAPNIASGDKADYDVLPPVGPYVDYGCVHFYAGQGHPPGFEYGVNSGIGYYGNVHDWAQAAMVGTKPMVLSECGASTTGAPHYARDGISQAYYCANQFFDHFSKNGAALHFYQLRDGNSALSGGGAIEANFGFFRSDGSPKPVATMFSRLKHLLSLNNNYDDPANATNTAAYKAGINPAAIVVSGLVKPPTCGTGVLLLTKSDGSSMLAIWNEPRTDDGNGNSVAPPDNLVTVNFGLSQQYRVHDPMGTASLTSGAWAAGTSMQVNIKGYPKLIEIKAPANYTQSGGDPRNVPATGSANFGVKQTWIAETVVDSGEVTAVPPAPLTPGNTLIALLLNDPGNNPSLPPGASQLGRYPRGSDCCITVVSIPITNAAQTFRFTGMQTWSSAMCAEVKAGSVSYFGTDVNVTGESLQANTAINFTTPPVPSNGMLLFAFQTKNSPTLDNRTGATSSGNIVVRATQTPTGQNKSGLYRWGFMGTSSTGGAKSLAVPNLYGNGDAPIAAGVMLVP